MSDTVTVVEEVSVITVVEDNISLQLVEETVDVVTVGTQGPAGPGVARGGAAGQYYRKHSGADYDGEWATPVSVGTSPPSSPAIGDLWVDTN